MKVELEEKDVYRIVGYNTILVLTTKPEDYATIEQFKTDCKQQRISFSIITDDNEPITDKLGLYITERPHYYALTKGDIVGFETGCRQGDAIKILANQGRAMAQLYGGESL